MTPKSRSSRSFGGQVRAVHEGGFSDLEPQVARLQPRCLDRLLHQQPEVLLHQLPARDVDRDAVEPASGTAAATPRRSCRPAAAPSADRLMAELSAIGMKTAGDTAAVAVPADQRLEPTHIRVANNTIG